MHVITNFSFIAWEHRRLRTTCLARAQSDIIYQSFLVSKMFWQAESDLATAIFMNERFKELYALQFGISLSGSPELT